MSNFYKIAITGSREWKDVQEIEKVLTNVSKDKSKKYTLIAGGAKGADTIAENIARKLKWDVIIHLPDWKQHGHAAGPIRNQLIIDEIPDILLAFPMPSSRGTYDTIQKANKSNIKVIICEKYIKKKTKNT